MKTILRNLLVYITFSTFLWGQNDCTEAMNENITGTAKLKSAVSYTYSSSPTTLSLPTTIGLCSTFPKGVRLRGISA